EFFAAGTRAVEAQKTLYQAAMAELDQAVTARVDAGERQKRLLEITVVAGLLAVAYLFAGFYLSVMRALNALTQTVRQTARGDLNSHAAIASQDEVALVADAFNDMTREFGRVIRSVSSASAEVAQSAPNCRWSPSKPAKAY
ncbi:HAMP domain-containing protein, partial [Methylogaea oryzae]|uniref:HAMP domain-containing protein n=1 Tax=Methylogaea oryzae TaxID=1295382 RepID=UPI001C3F2998